MALQGNLRDFTITQLLNLISLANKSGALLIEANQSSAKTIFNGGKLIYAQIDSEDGSLPQVLHAAKKVTDGQLRTLQTRASAMSDQELGLLLINAGYVTKQDIVDSLEAYFFQLVQQLFTWTEGQFRFDSSIGLPDGKIPVSIPLENLIMEGSRRLGELEQLKLEVPDLDMALTFTDRPGVNLKKVNLNVEEWRVVSYISPKNSIRQIAKATRMNELQIRRIIFGLLQAGLVQLVRPEGAPTQLQGIESSIPGVDREEQKSLVNRLIGRIRSI